MEDWRGQLISGYRIRERLGEGSIGVTYRAFHPSERTDVVFKVLSDHLNQQEEVLVSFRNLANRLMALQHPALVRVLGHDTWHDQAFFVTEFIAGINLRQVLTGAGGPLAWVDILHIGKQIARALVYVHEQQMYHQNLRPENVWLRRRGETDYQVVLTDLGIRTLLETSFQQGSQPNLPMVLAYLSPEQCVASPTGPKTDVYTLGIILYEMIAGQPPFRTPTVEQAAAMHLRAIPKGVGQHRIDVPPDVEELVAAMLAKQPRERPDMVSVAERLEVVAQRLGVTSGSPWEKLAGAVLADERRPTGGEQEPLVAPAPPQAEASRERSGLAELHISRPGEGTRVVPLTSNKRFTIGRDPGCDIVLKDRRVSRRHCEIHWDATGATVMDLGSNNGTYLGTARLIPHQAESLRAGTAIQIPPYTVRVEGIQAAEPSGEMPAAREEPAHDQSARYVTMSLDADELRVTPGGSPAAVTVNLENQARIVDWFSLGVFGVPHHWVSGTGREVRLNPRQQGSATLTFHPPPEPTTAAGTHPVQIAVHSREQGDVVASTDMALAVDSFARYEAELNPTRVESRTRASLEATVANQGNAPSQHTLSAKDDAQALMFEIEPDIMSLAPGASAVAQIKIAPRKPHWIGGKQSHPFTVTVTSSTAEPRTLPAQFAQRSWVPTWVPMLLMLLCCGTISLAALVVPPAIPTLFPKPTTTATATLTASPTASLTPTGTPSPTPTPNLTATWLPLDNDHDGLSNEQEFALGTDPNKTDTDGDDLSDGDEVNLYGSNPKNEDSDSDTWEDGYEVRLAEERFGAGGRDCPSPNNDDSDADNLKDAVDPDPCNLPTLTPSPTPTVTPVPSFGVGAQIANNDHLDMAKQAGLKWIKWQDRFHPGAQASRLAEQLNTWHNEGFKILLSVVGSPQDIAQGSAYYDQYAEYVGDLAAAGVDAIEVWNEMNIDREWPGGQISPNAYMELLRRASTAIRAQGPGVMVISGAPAPTGFFNGCSTAGCDDAPYVAGLAAAGAANLIDCVGIHYNEGVLSPSETSGDPREDHYTRYFFGMIDTYWQAFGGAVPLCFTELGYVSPEGYGALGAGFAWGTDTSVQEQAMWLAEAVKLAFESGTVKLVIIWNLNFTVYSQDDPQAGYAIIRRDGSCPACSMIQGVIRQLALP